MSKTINDQSYASNPGNIKLSYEKLCSFHPELFTYQGLWNRWRKIFNKDQIFWHTRHREHMETGDSRAALVISVNPLLIAAYTDELDCIAMLQFPDGLVHSYNLYVGKKLLTVNIYWYGDALATDLENGPSAFHRYANFSPLIAEFLTHDQHRTEQLKSQISEQEWARAYDLARVYIEKNGFQARDGLPMNCSIPAF